MYYWGQRVWKFYEQWWKAHAGYTHKIPKWEELAFYRPLSHSYFDKRVLSKNIVFPEDKLIKKYFHRYPKEKTQYTVPSGWIRTSLFIL
jgi:hypothetical protein